jgi:hypothetical protein
MKMGGKNEKDFNSAHVGTFTHRLLSAGLRSGKRKGGFNFGASVRPSGKGQYLRLGAFEL